jgi:hypothetical protein
LLAGARRAFSSRGEDDNDGNELYSERKETTNPVNQAPTPSDPVLSKSDDNNETAVQAKDESVTKMTVIYVHPLSRLVLLFFQTDEGYDWMASRGMVDNHTLRINDDGSIALAFPATGSSPSPPHPLFGEGNKQVSPSDGVADDLSKAMLASLVERVDVSNPALPISDAADPSSADSHNDQPQPQPSSRPQQDEIWTHYDAGEKRHWLCCTVQGKASRFLLQDCAEAAKEAGRRRRRGNQIDDEDEYESLWRHTPWKIGIHGNPKRTLADRVEDAVRAVMQEVDQAILADRLAAP